MKLSNSFAIIGCAALLSLTAVPSLRAFTPPNPISQTYNWVQDPGFSEPFSGFITIFGPPAGTGFAADYPDYPGGVIQNYDISTPVGDFNRANSTIDPTGTSGDYFVTWDTTHIIDMQLRITLDSDTNTYFYATESFVNAFSTVHTDPPGSWSVPEVSNTLLLFVLAAGALGVFSHVRRPRRAVTQPSAKRSVR